MKAPPENQNTRRRKATGIIKSAVHSNSTTAQRQRLLRALIAAKANGITTLEARALLDVLHPAGRVKDLRRNGHSIITHWIWQPTDCGKPHRVARYVLLKLAKA